MSAAPDQAAPGEPPRRRVFLARTWFQTLVGGLVLFYLLARALSSTGNPNYIPSLILIGAFLVPVVLIAYLYEHFTFQDVPLRPLAICFLWGGALGTIVAGQLEYQVQNALGPLSLLGVGVIEEGAKLLLPLLLFVRGKYRLEADGILFGVAAGMGFAALETMGYAFVALLESHGSLGALELTLLVRGLLSPAGHAAWTGLVCAVAWRERARAGHVVVNGRMLGALALAIVLHTVWDALQSVPADSLPFFVALQLLSLVVAVASLVLLIRRVREADREVRPVGQRDSLNPARLGPALSRPGRRRGHSARPRTDQPA